MTGAAPSFDEVFSFANLYECARACCKGVRWKAATQNFEASMPIWCANLRDELLAGRWRSSGFHRFTICERGKVRRISSVHISERTVQKCLVRHCLRPLVVPRLIGDSFATLPGKGTEAAVARHAEHARRFYRAHGRDGLVQIMDYSDYFASIDHGTLLSMYERLGLDGRTMDLLRALVDCFDDGLGLGSEVSQISAVYYISPVDHLVKDRLGVKCYGRYMDDSYIFATRSELAGIMREVRDASAGLGLAFNPRATHAHDLRSGWRYLKKRWLLTATGRAVARLDRGNIARARARVRQDNELVRTGAKDACEARASLCSWLGYADGYSAHRPFGRLRGGVPVSGGASWSCSGKRENPTRSGDNRARKRREGTGMANKDEARDPQGRDDTAGAETAEVGADGGEGAAGENDRENGEEEVVDSHGQPGINKERHDREVRELNDQIADLKKQVAKAAEEKSSREEMEARIGELEKSLATERDTSALERLGCIDVAVGLSLLPGFDGDADKLRSAKPYLFEDKDKGATGLKPEGAADDEKSEQAKADAALNYRRPKR